MPVDIDLAAVAVDNLELNHRAIGDVGGKLRDQSLSVTTEFRPQKSSISKPRSTSS